MSAVDLEAHLGEVRRALRAREQRPNKALGQHFLLGAGELRAIARAAGPFDGRGVLEIGAGPGGLTAALLEAGATVISLEVDAAWAGFTESRLGGSGRLSLRVGDARERGGAILGELLEEIVRSTGRPPVVASNLPYQVASPILVDLFQSRARPDPAVAMVQSEVAERLRAVPGARERGLLTVLVGLHGRVRRLRRVPPGAFQPPPKVSSAVVEIRPHERPLAEDTVLTRAGALARRAFQGRRKMLRGSLRCELSGEQLGRHASRRPEELSEEEWVALARASAG